MESAAFCAAHTKFSANQLWIVEMLAMAYKILLSVFLPLLYYRTFCVLIPKRHAFPTMRFFAIEKFAFKNTSLDSHLMSASRQPLRILPKEDLDRWDVRSRPSRLFYSKIKRRVSMAECAVFVLLLPSVHNKNG